MADFKLWKNYTRKQIAARLGYRGEAAIWRGVVTPKGARQIWLFVTREKQRSQTQYNDSIYGNVLVWEGEERGRNDKRIANASAAGEEIFLFFRAKHHQEFIYFGRIHLENYELRTGAPSRFCFEIEAWSLRSESRVEAEASPLFADSGSESTTRIAPRKERIGQGRWRQRLLQLWDHSCSVTSLRETRLLRASHIKPWQHSSNADRLHQHNGLILNPSLDCLFDCGFVTFRHGGGRIEISSVLNEHDRNILNVHEEMSLRKIFSENKEYLEYHSDCVFEKWIKASRAAESLF